MCNTTDNHFEGSSFATREDYEVKMLTSSSAVQGHYEE
jgi:hypothetical protein